jgi:hypothetical protein
MEGHLRVKKTQYNFVNLIHAKWFYNFNIILRIQYMKILNFDLYAGLQFWTKYGQLIFTSTYTWVNLYASIYGKLPLAFFNLIINILIAQPCNPHYKNTLVRKPCNL